MFSQPKNKRFNYQTRFSSEEEQKKDVLRTNLKRIPKQNNTKVSTLIVLLSLLVLVGVVMYMLESKMN